jgi:hypothetical protein
MKVWVYVEGEADRNALNTLWDAWRKKLQIGGWGIAVIPLGSKSRFFQKIGQHTAEKICANQQDLVVGLPDLYPNSPYATTKFKHEDVCELKQVQQREVAAVLQTVYGLNAKQVSQHLGRFLPCVLKYDLEMLLLAAREQLRAHLGTIDQLGGWQRPVEDQDQNQPPKHLVQQLFRTKSVRRHAYRDTKDASAILRNVTDMKTILYDATDRAQCPVFKEMLDWIGKQTGIPGYQ